MTTIGDLYKSSDAKTNSWLVTIGAATLTEVEEVGWDFKVGVIPTAYIKVPGRAPAVAVYQARVRIQAGFNGLMERQFTGIVQDIDPSPDGDTIRCVGQSWPLDVHYHEVVYTFNNVTAHDALEDLFEDSGIEDYSVSVPAWTICSVIEQEHEWETYGEAITGVGEVDGCRWYELPNGTVRIHEQDPIPAATYWRTYFTGVLLAGYAMTWPTGTTQATDGYPRIRNVGGQSRLRDCKNRARVKGAVIDTAGGHGTTAPVDITATAYADSDWVLNPDGSQAYNDLLFNSDLIDMDAKAAEVAVRLVVANNRLLMTVNIEIDGDPETRLCRTVRIVDPVYSGINSRWYVEGYSSRMDEDDFVTTLTLIGGPDAGSEINIDPFAVFTYAIEREVIGDKEWATVTFDASPSYDLDGTIVSYLWSDNLGIIAGTDAVMNVRCDAETTTGWLVTLEVTDNDGLTNSLTLPVEVQPALNPDVFIPALFVAFGTYASGSPDGGVTWNDQVLPDCISVGAKAADGVHAGIGLFGTSGGEIWRTADTCASALTLVVDVVATGGHPVTFIWWDLRLPTVVWACTQNGGLYWSWDDGLTWAYYDDLAALFGLVNIRLTRIGTPLAGGVWVWGGTGTGYPLIAFDPVVGSHSWVGANLGGELLADIVAPFVPAGLQVAQGTYVGNGAVGAVTGLGFAPKVVVVKGDTVTEGHAVIRTDTMPGSRGVTSSTSAPGLALGADGFTVTYAAPDNSNTNAAGVTYYWYAIGGANCKTGSYTGDGGAAHGIVGAGFAPVMAWVIPDPVASSCASSATFRTPEMTTESFDFGLSLGSTTQIKSLDADGFTVGTDTCVNQNAETFHYVAFAASPNLASGMYAGDSVDGRNLPSPALSFNPDLVVIKSHAGQEANFKVTSLPGDAAFFFGNQVAQTNRIQSLTPAAGQFQVGNDAETNHVVITEYFWFAMEEALGTGGLDLDLYIADAAASGQYTAIMLNSNYLTPAVYGTDDILGDGSHWKRATGAPAYTRGAWISNDIDPAKFCMGFSDDASYSNQNYVGDVTAGALAVAAAAAPLDVGDLPNHGIWLGWWVNGKAGTYIIAAEATGTTAGTLYKTWDRFAHVGKIRPATGFTVPPAGAKAKMVAMGAPGTALASGRALMAGLLAAPDRFAAWLLDDYTWHKYEFAASELAGCDLLLPKALTKDLWFIVGFDGASFYNDSQVVRTINQGAAWASFTQPKSGNDWWQDFVIAADGRIWGLTLDITDNIKGTMKVWFADDGLGNVWTLAYSRVIPAGANYERLYKIVCHPTDANILAIYGSRNVGKFQTIYSLDRGATWSENFTNQAKNQEYGQECGIVMLSNRRLVTHAVASPSGHRPPIIVTADQSDGYGAWTTRYTSALSITDSCYLLGPRTNLTGSKIYFVEVHAVLDRRAFLLESLDSGVSFHQVGGDITPGAIWRDPVGGLAYDPPADAVMVMTSGAVAVNDRLVSKLSPILTGPPWVDCSDTLVPMFGHVSYSLTDEGLQICFIPR